MWTWFEGWSRSFPEGRWSRTVAGGSPTFADRHAPAEDINSTEAEFRWDNLRTFDWRAEWTWEHERGWRRERGEYRPGLQLEAQEAGPHEALFMPPGPP